MSNVIEIRKENNTLSEDLNEKNNIIFRDMVCYLRVSNLSEYYQEEIINDILIMFLAWQKDEKSIESMIGDNYKKFVDDIIEASPKMTLFQKLSENFKMLVDIFGIIFTIDFGFEFLFKGIIAHNYNLKFDYTIGALIRYLIIYISCICIFNYIGKNSFKLSKIHFSKSSDFIFCTVLFIICLFLLCMPRGIVIISMGTYTMLGLISVFWCYKLIEKLLKI